MFVVPVPGFGVNMLTDRAKDTQTAEIMVFHVLGTESAKEANDSRSRIELGKLVLMILFHMRDPTGHSKKLPNFARVVKTFASMTKTPCDESRDARNQSFELPCFCSLVSTIGCPLIPEADTSIMRGSP